MDLLPSLPPSFNVNQKVKQIRRRRASSRKNRRKRKLRSKEKKQEASVQKEIEIDQWLLSKRVEQEKWKEESDFHKEIMSLQRVTMNEIGSIKSSLNKLKLLQKYRLICIENTEPDNHHFQETYQTLRSNLLNMLNFKKNLITKLQTLIGLNDRILPFGQSKDIKMNSSVEDEFQQIRSLWNSYINEAGSSIPSKWFYQNQPNNQWKSFILQSPSS